MTIVNYLTIKYNIKYDKFRAVLENFKKQK